MAGPVRDKDVADQIAKLYDLHESGVLSKAEFETAKRRVLGEQPPRMVAQPPPVASYEQDRLYSEPKRPRSFGKVFLIVAGLVLLLVWIASLSSNDDSDNSDLAVIPTTTREDAPAATALPTEPPEPTATAIPRSGIQTIRLSITTQDGWEAWGDGCVGGGDVAWAENSIGVVIAPSDASGTFQGVRLGAGVIDESDRCHWSARLTTRASDAYRIKVGDHDVVCHSNMMMPTEDGFFAAVVLDGNGVDCATVLSVSDEPPTPLPASTP